MNLIREYSEIFTGLVGFVLGSGVTLAMQKVRIGKSGNFADQRKSTVTGDQAGRDISKKR